MKFPKHLLSISLFAGLSVSAYAATQVTVTIDTGGRSLRNELNSALPGGNLGINGDGAVFQLGYYVSATPGSNFGNGNFVPLTGEGSLFNVSTTIGDAVFNSAGHGELFSVPLDIFTGLNGGVNDSLLPASGTPLSVRFFNSTTIGLSTYFEAVSNNSWLWQTPANAPTQPNISVNFDDPGLVAKSGANVGTSGTNIQTNTQIVPEPTSGVLMVVGLLSLAARRRRQAN